MILGVCVEDSETGPWLCSTSLILLRASAPKPISTGGFSPSPDLKEISTLLGVSTSKTVHFFLVCLFVCGFFSCVYYLYTYIHVCIVHNIHEINRKMQFIE